MRRSSKAVRSAAVRAAALLVLIAFSMTARTTAAAGALPSTAAPTQTNAQHSAPSKPVQWNALPLQHAITTKRGTGRRKIAVLADPNCDYCQKFEAELLKLDDITIYVLPYPVVRSQSKRQVKSIWCSKDRAKAWADFMFRRIEPPDAGPCNDPVDEIVAFGRRRGIDATPTWFLENGEQYSGMKRNEELRQLLDRASPAAR